MKNIQLTKVWHIEAISYSRASSKCTLQIAHRRTRFLVLEQTSL